MTISLKKIAATLLVGFILLIAVGAYLEQNEIIVLSYLIISTLVFLVPFSLNRRDAIYINYKKISKAWVAFLILSVVTTVIHGRWNNMHTVFIEITFFYIALLLTACTDLKLFLKYFRNLIVLLSFLGIITFFFDIDFFSGIKNSTGYLTVDTAVGGGISSVFEFRHYYGAFLVCTLITLLEYNYSNRIFQFISFCCVLVNIALTFTINTWISCIIVLLFYLYKKSEYKITQKAIIQFIEIVALIILFGVVFYNIWQTLFINLWSRFLNAIASIDENTVRVYTFTNGIEYILHVKKEYFWIGGGCGTAIEWLIQNPAGQWKQWNSAIDMQYVTIFMDNGLIGVVLILSIFVKAIKKYISKNNYFYLVFLMFFIIMMFFEIIGTSTSIFAFWCICICFLFQEERVVAK